MARAGGRKTAHLPRHRRRRARSRRRGTPARTLLLRHRPRPLVLPLRGGGRCGAQRHRRRRRCRCQRACGRAGMTQIRTLGMSAGCRMRARGRPRSSVHSSRDRRGCPPHGPHQCQPQARRQALASPAQCPVRNPALDPTLARVQRRRPALGLRWPGLCPQTQTLSWGTLALGSALLRPCSPRCLKLAHLQVAPAAASSHASRAQAYTDRLSQPMLPARRTGAASGRRCVRTGTRAAWAAPQPIARKAAARRGAPTLGCPSGILGDPGKRATLEPTRQSAGTRALSWELMWG